MMNIKLVAAKSRSFSCKPDFDESVARIYAWYNQTIIDRVPVRFYHHNMEYEQHRTIKGPWKTAEERWLDVDFQVGTFAESLEGMRFSGETFPVFWPNLSALAYNLFLGQRARFDDVTAWVQPCVEDIENLPSLRVQWDNKYFRTIEALTRRALEFAEGRFMVGYTDMYAGPDCAMGIRGTEHMCLDLLMHPQYVHRLMEMTFAEYPKVYEHFDVMLKANGQLSITWMNLPSYETFNVLACDFAVNISPDHFNEFCMPILRKEALSFEHNVFHLDGPGVAKNIDAILTLPNLVAVQWVQGYGCNRPILQWVPLIRTIQEAGKSVIVDLQLDELYEFMHQLDPQGIMLWIPAEQDVQRDVLRRVKCW
jgi:hypothetical protein